MKCLQCQTELNENDIRCPKCGLPIYRIKNPKKCTNCHYELEKDDIFCPNCGTKIIKKYIKECTNCHNILREDDAFCPICGTKVINKQSSNINPSKKNIIFIILILIILLLSLTIKNGYETGKEISESLRGCD